jgi:hypothetical protein
MKLAAATHRATHNQSLNLRRRIVFPPFIKAVPEEWSMKNILHHNALLGGDGASPTFRTGL